MITAAEVMNLLRLLANIDARTIGKDDIALWHAALGQDRVTFIEARQAVIEQVRVEPSVRVNVGHVIFRVRDRRRLRRAGAGTGMALQEALRAIPADAPDYQARVMELLREPTPPARESDSSPALESSAAVAAERAHRGRALVDAALAERRRAKADAAGDSGRESDLQRAAAAHRAQRARSSDPQPIALAVVEAATVLKPRRTRQPAE
jgi:hypothetical protein